MKKGAVIVDFTPHFTVDEFSNVTASCVFKDNRLKVGKTPLFKILQYDIEFPIKVLAAYFAARCAKTSKKLEHEELTVKYFLPILLIRPFVIVQGTWYSRMNLSIGHFFFKNGAEDISLF